MGAADSAPGAGIPAGRYMYFTNEHVKLLTFVVTPVFSCPPIQP